MIKTLKLIWFRIWKTKEVPILLIVVFVYSLIAVLGQGVFANIYYNSQIQAGVEPIITTFRSDILLDLLNPTGLPMLACYLAVTLFITTEWKNNTFRNQVLSGKSRNQIYSAYLIFALLTYLVFLAVSILPVYTLSYCFRISDMSEMGSPFILILFVFFMIGLTLVGVAFGFSFIFHNRLAPIGMVIALISIISMSGLISSLLPVISNKNLSIWFNTYPFNEFLLGYQLNIAKAKYLDIYSYATLITDGTDKALSLQIGTGRTAVFMTKAFFTNAIWQGLMFFFGNLAFRKRDMK